MSLVYPAILTSDFPLFIDFKDRKNLCFPFFY